jgi:hypothetical protein
MEKDILSEVVEIERTIKERLLIEESKSKEWLDRVRGEGKKEVLAEESLLKESMERGITEAQAQARVRAYEMINRTNAIKENIERLTDEELKVILRKYIPGILGEE